MTRFLFLRWKVGETDENGTLKHVSGRFFSIEGIQVETDYGDIRKWTQPIINQPEIGYLGILTKEFNGILYFLMQAKIEPGNVNCVQISPTLQATKSNYLQIHKGLKPSYLDYFCKCHSQADNIGSVTIRARSPVLEKEESKYYY